MGLVGRVANELLGMWWVVSVPKGLPGFLLGPEQCCRAGGFIPKGFGCPKPPVVSSVV